MLVVRRQMSSAQRSIDFERSRTCLTDLQCFRLATIRVNAAIRSFTSRASRIVLAQVVQVCTSHSFNVILKNIESATRATTDTCMPAAIGMTNRTRFAHR
jgi:hypothetical protein